MKRISLFAAVALALGTAFAQADALDESLLHWKPESGITFDGQSQYLMLQESSPLNGDEITLEAWIRFSNDAFNQVFLTRGQPSEDITFYLFQGRIRMLTQDPQGYTHANAPSPPAGQWFHCVGAYHADGTKRLYYNGVLVGETQSEHRPLASNQPLIIGAQRPAAQSSDRFFNGEMENIRVWNRALAEDEIAALLAASTAAEDVSAMRDHGLLAYWAARSVESDAVRDLSGRGADASMITEEIPDVIIQSDRDDGYRGIWFTLGQFREFGDKYSGGLGTYTANHVPIAIYAPEVDKTFFVYGGSRNGERYLLAMASYYDHQTGLVPRPTIVHDKQGIDDPHDNPSLTIDEHGHLWVFVSGRGRGRPGIIYRSLEPYSTDAFEQVYQGEFTYPQAWWVEGKGFIHLNTKYTRGRELYFELSKDGRNWGEPVKLAGMLGHYQVSNQFGERIITAFMRHPDGSVDRRTDLYYAETSDMGQTWRTVDGQLLELPLEEFDVPALVRNYEAEGRLVYINDTQLDSDGNPVIFYVTASLYQPGPPGEPRFQTIAHWNGQEWNFSEVARTTHNYDVGSIHIEGDVWRIFAPAEPGPQHWGCGGEVAIWRSEDQGATWMKERDVTRNSPMNHHYVRRPVNAHDDFYAYWADGNPDEFSPSYLYFANKDGSNVWRLPYVMEDDYAAPERIEFFAAYETNG